MAEAALSMALMRISLRIAKMVRDEVKLHRDAKTEIEKLYGKLETIQKVLADAEQRGVTDLKVRSWLSKLQDIAYDIDDVLDEWVHDILKHQFAEEEPCHSSKMVFSFTKSHFYKYLNRIIKHHNIAVTVRKLNERLDSVAKQNDQEFNFVPDVSLVSYEFKRNETSSQIDVSEVQGREEELKYLVNELVGKNECGGSGTSSGAGTRESGVQVISIVGSGGMGKTTLAQLAFQKVKHRFDEIAWVCVSDPFDAIKVAKGILEGLNMSSPDLTQLDPLLRHIERGIEKKTFLIVFYDVWLENQETWTPLWNTLKDNGTTDSKILVTTRSTKVAKTIGSSRVVIQELGPVSDSDCWSIFSRLAFQDKDTADEEMLEGTGRLIANKCKGLPLAAKIIGSHLSSTNRLEEWEKVLKDEVWKLEKANTDLFPIIRLSYNKLNHSSKRCFSYCAMFPKDYEFSAEFSKRLWMSQGFVPGRDVNEVEINAQKIFEDLAARSFFQDFVRNFITGCIESFKIHDILHNFAASLADRECLTLSLNSETPSEPYSCQNARHILISSSKNSPFSISHSENIHTFLLYGTKPPQNFFTLVKRCRALDFYDSGVIREEVGHLIHLRFLALESNEILELPGTIFNLFELQTLYINGCSNLRRLPNGIHKLQNLRHLRIPKNIELPQELETLCNLRTLATFGGNKTNKLGYLQNLGYLRYLAMEIKGLNEAEDVWEAKRANFKNKMFLQFLTLELVHSDGLISMNIVEALQPPTNLSHLWLHRSIKIPTWMISLTNLRGLYLYHSLTIDWSHLSNLPALENLKIDYMPKSKNIGRDFLGMEMEQRSQCHDHAVCVTAIFPRLKKLEFYRCWKWEEWEDITEEEEKNNGISIFSCLESLDINDCGELKVLPHCLLRKAAQLKSLRIRKCPYLGSRYNQHIGEDWQKISHISNVQIVE